MAEFTVAQVDYAQALPALRQVREAVFVREQRVPVEEEWDALDPLSLHLLARDAAGAPIGTARLTPDHRIGRMAVLAPWRSRGVGDALLGLALRQAEQDCWEQVRLNAQVSAEGFYARHGFLPVGERFMEAGIEHQAMRLRLHGPMAVETQAEAAAALLALAASTRSLLCLYSRDLDPGLLDAAAVAEALRALAVRRRGAEIRILLQDPDAPLREGSVLLALAQRLPSSFQLRAVADPVDRGYPSAFACNEAGSYLFRPLGHRFDGEFDRRGPGRARQLREQFGRFWERARPCTELRALEL
ncbi:MAG: GNAT family N-acetyltransferase [Pseudoxanthomonas sp.]